MKLDLGTTSLLAVICSTPFASKFVFARDRNRQRGISCRSQFPENFKWIRRLNSSVNHGDVVHQSTPPPGLSPVFQGPSLIETNTISSSSPADPNGIQNCEFE